MNDFQELEHKIMRLTESFNDFKSNHFAHLSEKVAGIATDMKWTTWMVRFIVVGLVAAGLKGIGVY